MNDRTVVMVFMLGALTILIASAVYFSGHSDAMWTRFRQAAPRHALTESCEGDAVVWTPVTRYVATCKPPADAP